MFFEVNSERMLNPYFEMDSIRLRVPSVILALQLGRKGEFQCEGKNSLSHKLASLMGDPRVLVCA